MLRVWLLPWYTIHLGTFAHFRIFLYVFINYHDSYGKINKRDVICQLKKKLHISNLFHTKIRQSERENSNEKTHANTSQNIHFTTGNQFDLLERFYVRKNAGDGLWTAFNWQTELIHNCESSRIYLVTNYLRLYSLLWCESDWNLCDCPFFRAGIQCVDFAKSF